MNNNIETYSDSDSDSDTDSNSSDDLTINNQVLFNESRSWFSGKNPKIPKLRLSALQNNFVDEVVLLDDEIEEPKNIPPPVVVGKVIKVNSGNMIRISSKLPIRDSIDYSFKVRLKGIQVPYIKSIYKEERKLGKLAKYALHDLICGKTVVLKNTQVEKYGILVSDIYLHGLNINRWLIDYNYAHECEY